MVEIDEVVIKKYSVLDSKITGIFSLIKKTTLHARKNSKTFSIDEVEFEKFVKSLDSKAVKKRVGSPADILNFDNLNHKLNFLTLFGVLNIGSGYRKELHKICDLV